MKKSRNEASVFFEFDNQTDGFWLAMLDVLEKKPTLKHEIDAHVHTLVAVKSYSLEDHQFLQITVDLTKAKDMLVSIPREKVKGIVEGKAELPNFSFAGQP